MHILKLFLTERVYVACFREVVPFKHFGRSIGGKVFSPQFLAPAPHKLHVPAELLCLVKSKVGYLCIEVFA